MGCMRCCYPTLLVLDGVVGGRMVNQNTVQANNAWRQANIKCVQDPLYNSNNLPKY